MQAIATLARRSAIMLTLTLGLIAGLGYLLAYLAERNQDRFTDWLSGYLGFDVRIEQLAVDWQLPEPTLRLEGVEVGDPNDPMRVARAKIDFELTDILSASGPLRFSIVGSQLHLIREPGGQLRITGLPEFEPQNRGGPANRPVKLNLIDATITWEDRKYRRAPLTFESVSGSLQGSPGEWRLAAQIRSDHGNLAFAGSLLGDPTGPDWGGYTKVHASGLDLAKLLGGYFPQRYQLRSARVDGELQIFWRAARLAASIGKLVATDMHLIGDEPLQVDRLAAGFHFDRETEHWRLALNDLVVERAGKRWPATRLEVEATALAAGARELAIAADYLQLEDLVALALVRPPQPSLRPLLDALQPKGELHDLRLRLRLDDKAPAWQAAARLEELSMQRFGKVPGIDRLRGELRANRQHVQVQFEAQNTQLDFGPLFRQPIDIIDLGGQLDWQLAGNQGWQLRSDGLRIATPDLTTRTRLLITHTPTAPLLLDIQTGFLDANASRIGRYYPVDIMRPQLVDWLDRAIVGGTLTGGTVVLRGPAADFPFDKTRNGHFEALFGVRDLILDYQLNWPRLEEMTADVRIHNNDLEIRVDGAKIYDSDVRNMTAVIRQLSPVTPVEIRGEVRGPLTDELRVLRESPLAKDFGNMVDGLSARGQVNLNLDIAVPIGKLGDYRLHGKLQLHNNRLHLVNWQLPLEDIEGALQFDLESIRASGIRAMGLGRPLTIGVAPGKDGKTLISTTARIDVRAISKQLPGLPLNLTTLATGSSQFNVRLEIPGLAAAPGTPTWLDVRSDLKGTAVDLPAPLGKPSAAPRPLQVRVPVSGRRRPGRMRYGNLLDAAFDLDGGRAQLRFGRGTATRPEVAGFEVLGHIPRLELEPWIRAAQRLTAAPGSSTVNPPLRIDMTFDDLLAGDFQASDLRLQLRDDARAWRGEFDSPQIAGRFSAPKSWPEGQLTIDLERLVLNFDPTTEDDPPNSDNSAAAADPRAWPSVDFRCRSLQTNQVESTDVELSMVRSPQGLIGKHLRFAGELATFEGMLSWEAGAKAHRSSIAGKLVTPNLGDFLDRLGYTPQLADTPADIDFALTWPGSPPRVDRRRLNGQVGLDLGAGRFLDFDPGVTRVVGLLNLSALQRRLRLDFSDLFKRGLSFDEITGQFTLDSGDAYTNDFQLIGPTGTIEIAGRTGIATRDFDQMVSVTPKLDATLPIAGTIAGGPVAGLAAWVAQRVMHEQVDRINRFQYSVKGPWANPTIVVLSSGGTLSKIFGLGQDEPILDGSEDPSAKPNRSSVNSASSERQVGDPARPALGNGAEAIDQDDILDQPSSSILDRLLDQLAPTGSGRDFLDAAD